MECWYAIRTLRAGEGPGEIGRRFGSQIQLVEFLLASPRPGRLVGLDSTVSEQPTTHPTVQPALPPDAKVKHPSRIAAQLHQHASLTPPNPRSSFSPQSILPSTLKSDNNKQHARAFRDVNNVHSKKNLFFFFETRLKLSSKIRVEHYGTETTKLSERRRCDRLHRNQES